MVTIDQPPLTTTAPDWDLAKALWLQDLPRKTIAEKARCTVGALKARAIRGRWASTRIQSVAIAAQVLGDDLEGASKRIQKLFVQDVERSALALARHNPDKLPLHRLEIRERTASMMQKRAWSTLGLDSQANPNVVNITMLSAISDAVELSNTQLLTVESPSEDTTIPVVTEPVSNVQPDPIDVTPTSS